MINRVDLQWRGIFSFATSSKRSEVLRSPFFSCCGLGLQVYYRGEEELLSFFIDPLFPTPKYLARVKKKLWRAKSTNAAILRKGEAASLLHFFMPFIILQCSRRAELQSVGGKPLTDQSGTRREEEEKVERLEEETEVGESGKEEGGDRDSKKTRMKESWVKEISFLPFRPLLSLSLLYRKRPPPPPARWSLPPHPRKGGGPPFPLQCPSSPHPAKRRPPPGKRGGGRAVAAGA